MEKRISGFAIHKTALTAATFMTAFSLLILLVAILSAIFNGQFAVAIMVLFLPVLYFIFTYISAAVMLCIYNLVAKHCGLGITIKLENVPKKPKPKKEAEK